MPYHGIYLKPRVSSAQLGWVGDFMGGGNTSDADLGVPEDPFSVFNSDPFTSTSKPMSNDPFAAPVKNPTPNDPFAAPVKNPNPNDPFATPVKNSAPDPFAPNRTHDPFYVHCISSTSNSHSTDLLSFTNSNPTTAVNFVSAK